ncbi:hypothetical protein GIB67_008054 [Kingdonia uniflora]|uniref:Pentatricopeptide repeat-containing protein n=1 Tax=Kingdonia uniflora TaxID=39325 RepID=A0A7J7MN98_9MAGN|nr:hypothetical protein GIB67_008054 [Kingdonia uniflora]
MENDKSNVEKDRDSSDSESIEKRSVIDKSMNPMHINIDEYEVLMKYMEGLSVSIGRELNLFTVANIEDATVKAITIEGCAHFPSNSLPFEILIHGRSSDFDKMVVKNSMSWNTMTDGYMRNGGVNEGNDLFDRMPVRDKVSWTALISGFVKKDCFKEALDWFIKMHISRVEPNYVTLNTVLAACANLGELGLGIWNLIIVGFVINGHTEEALEHFFSIQKEGFIPNDSFTWALTACSHAELVEKGFQFRSGRLKDAFRMIRSMPMKPNEVILGILLAACNTRRNLSLARKLMGYIVEIDPNYDSNYMLLLNMYATNEKWDNVNKARKKIKALGIEKKP